MNIKKHFAAIAVVAGLSGASAQACNDQTTNNSNSFNTLPSDEIKALRKKLSDLKDAGPAETPIEREITGNLAAAQGMQMQVMLVLLSTPTAKEGFKTMSKAEQQTLGEELDLHRQLYTSLSAHAGKSPDREIVDGFSKHIEAIKACQLDAGVAPRAIGPAPLKMQ